MRLPTAGNLTERLAKDRHAAMRLICVSRETEDRLAEYVDMLSTWQRTLNLVSEKTLPLIWTRHVADSAQIFRALPGAEHWVDMGSGAGFPGLVIAIQLASDPGAIVHCIESDQRKCAFLRETARATGARARIHPMRVQAIDPVTLGRVDAVTARAFAPLSATLQLARIWLDRGAIGVFPLGRSAKGDLDALRDASDYSIETFPSIVDRTGVIVRIRTH
jgi:16S rRNA (guanine527-N7)-methyltransferase